MAQVETISACNPVDLSLSGPSSASDSPLREAEKKSRWGIGSLVQDILSLVPSRRPIPPVPAEKTWKENIFPFLPPLFYGHPEVHLRNGIMNASRLATSGVPDSEKAFFVADLSEVYRQHQRWTKCLPDIVPFYAVKCNPDPYVIRLLAALGAGFDCASIGEIRQILNVGGIDPCRIIFANPCKAVSFIRNAAARGVDTMSFDNIDELYKIARCHPNAKAIVRILTDDSKSLCAFGIKFGAPLVTVAGLLAKAKELGVNVVGVSFHVGSGCYDPSVYDDAIRRARSVFDLGKHCGFEFNILDVGGGFEDHLFEQAAHILTEAINTNFPDRQNIQIIAEPGRFYVAKAFRLAVHIIARRAPPDAAEAMSDQASVMYYINDGVYGAFNGILFDHQVVRPHVLCMGGSFHVASSEPHQRASIWGPTCDSIDCVSPMTLLPSGLRIGDWLGFDRMGAYTICAASQFNGFELSKVVYTAGVNGAQEVCSALTAFAGAG